MWPWGHLAFGYVMYSLSVHIVRHRSPTDATVVVLGFATQFPDLVDKTFAWVIPVFEHGRLIAHSLLVAVPMLVLVLVVARHYRRIDLGVAAVVGYLSHLLGDGIYSAFSGGGIETGFLFWPLVAPPEQAEGFGVVYAEFVSFLLTARGVEYLVMQFGFLLFTLLLWLYDGMPPVRRYVSR